MEVREVYETLHNGGETTPGKLAFAAGNRLFDCMEIGLEQAISELKALPGERQSVATSYIHRLFAQSRAERNEQLQRAFGIGLSVDEADEWLEAAGSCRQVEGDADVETW